jgi:hypothetical protein
MKSPATHYRSAGPMRLWLLDRVVTAETDAHFSYYQESRAKRVSGSPRGS